MARLTILLPAYNASPYINEAVTSLLKQSFADFELWIIDDGSTDNTREIIDGHRDHRITKFFHDTNRGKVVIVNELIGKVTSEFVTVTDADDISHPLRLAMQISQFDDDSELMMCGTSYHAIYPNGQIIRSLSLKSDYREIYDSIVDQSRFLGATVVMRTKILERMSEFYRPYFSDGMEDSDLNARIVDNFKCINLPQKLYFYRILRNSLSRKKYSVRISNLYQAISFLTGERRRSGVDSLMKNNPEAVDQHLELIAEENKKDPSLIHRRAAFYFMYWKLSATAWNCACKAWIKKWWSLKNNLLVAYIAVLVAVEVLRKKTHYKNLILDEEGLV
ncbi:MAG: glycosyltransferase family 2 protein [Cyclobacteriaceae bacterium]